ncbi:MAG TPA: hypothetical protein VGK99_00660 [Acidobacteriota bacterium]|jgi:hypothetical protein
MPKAGLVQWIIAIVLVVIAVEMGFVVRHAGMFDGPQPDDWPVVDNLGYFDAAKIPLHAKCKTTHQLLQYIACAQETELKLLNIRLPKPVVTPPAVGPGDRR